jgi:hypothetical protein
MSATDSAARQFLGSCCYRRAGAKGAMCQPDILPLLLALTAKRIHGLALDGDASDPRCSIAVRTYRAPGWHEQPRTTQRAAIC